MSKEKRKPYPIDLTDIEWEKIKPMIKEDVYFGPQSRTKHSHREIFSMC